MPEYRGIKLRHELKFILDETEYFWLRDRVSQLLPLDRNADPGTRLYSLRSLYFDDMFNTAMWEKQDGVEFRDKYRIRLYRGSNELNLEKKSKLEYYTAKTSARMTAQQCDALLHGDYRFLYPSEEPLFRELYARIKAENLRPCVLVDYDREAYIHPMGNVRVTFDRNLHSAQFGTDIFAPGVSPIPIMDPGTLIMEVKYDDFLPAHIKLLLQGTRAQRTAYSKFAMCRRYQ